MNIKKDKSQKSRPSIFKRILRNLYPIFMIFFAFVIIAFISLIIYSKTEHFQNWANSLVNESLQSQLQPGVKFHFKSISISYLIGFQINDFKLSKDKQTIIECSELHSGIKILPLLKNKIIVNEILIKDPKIFVSKSSVDSLWNVEKIFIPSQKKEPTQQSKLSVNLQRIRFINGNISLYDSTISQQPNKNKFDFNHFNLENFNLNLNAKFDLSKQSYDIKINKLNFIETKSNFKLNALKLIAQIDTTQINIQNFSITSGNSNLQFEAIAKNINVFKENLTLDPAQIKFKIKTENLDLAEISKFIPDINLFGDLRFSINGEGNSNYVKINADKLTIDNSSIKFKLKIENPTDDNPNISIAFNSSKVYEKDILTILADFKNLYIPRFKVININSTAINFHKNIIKAKFNIKSPIVNTKGSINLNLNGNYSYKGKLNIKKLNLSPMLKDKNLYSKINASISFDGKGNNAKNLRGKINIKSQNSKFADFNFADIETKIQIQKPGKINIDTIHIQFKNDNFQESNNQNIIASSGNIDYKDLFNTHYKLGINIKDFSPNKIFKDSTLPQNISSKILIEGQGIEPDDIIANIHSPFIHWKFNTKQMPNLAFDLAIDTKNRSKKQISFQSDFINLNLLGNFKFNSLINLAQNSVNTIEKQAFNKIKAITLQNDSIIISDNLHKRHFDSLKINFSLKLKDSVLMKELLNFKEFNSDLSLQLDVEQILNKTLIKLSELSFNKFTVNDGSQQISTIDANFQGDFTLQTFAKIDSLTNFKFLLKLPNGLKIDDFIINSSQINAEYKNDKVSLSTKSNLANNIEFLSNLSIEFLNNLINLNFNNFQLNYNDIVKLSNNSDINIAIFSDKINVKNFDLAANIFGMLSIDGIIKQNGFDDFNIKLKNFDIKQIYSLTNNIDKELPDLFTGKIDSIEVTLSNTFDNTYIKTATSISGISVNGKPVGQIYSEFQHKDTTLSGFINSYIENKVQYRNVFSLNIAELPINLSLISKSNRFNENAPIRFSLTSNNFLLNYFSPFLKGIRNFKGYADINLKVNGKDLKSIDYLGSLTLKKMSYLLDFNNLKFYTNAKINLKKDSILIKKITISNDYYDLKDGKLTSSGYISLKEFNIDKFDIRFNTKKFKILSNASMKSMPSLYGDFIVAFKQIRFFGNLNEPNIKGDLNILTASLKMPSSNSKEITKSKLIYKYKSNKSIDFEIVKDSSSFEAKKEITQKKSSDFTNALNIDIGIKFKGKFIATMDIAGLGQLFAEIGTQNPDDVIRFVMNKNLSEPSIYGADIIVKENSTINLIKTFKTKGSISFPKGIIENPSLNLTATYNGKRYFSDQISYYTVNMNIKGTKNEPLISFSYSIDGQEAQGDSSKINEDAILLLTLGKTKAELNPNSYSSGNSDLFSSTASSVASSMASSAITDLVQATGFIQSADIDIGNSITNFDQAKMKLSGEIRGIRWTLGGTVADFANNNEISIDVPLPIDLGINWMNHFIFQLTKASNSNQTATTRSQKDWEIKFKLGGSW